MFFRIAFLILLVHFYTPGCSMGLEIDGTYKSKTNAQSVNEMLVPRYSTTALICDPIFIGTNGTAKWFHDGIEIASVTSTSNAILQNRTFNGESAPDVGFLIIANISSTDEGEYWCRRDDSGKKGDVTRIVVAYVDEFSKDTEPIFHPKSPRIGGYFFAECPPTLAVPFPYIKWTLNGKPVEPVADRVKLLKNGSLVISRFLHNDIGVYECIVSNFAGKSIAKGLVDLKEEIGQIESDDRAIFELNCQNLVHGCLSWFLIGCLVTSCSILTYLLCAMILIKPYNRNRAFLHCFVLSRSQNNPAPRFRKVIAPIPDSIRQARQVAHDREIA